MNDKEMTVTFTCSISVLVRVPEAVNTKDAEQSVTDWSNDFETDIMNRLYTLIDLQKGDSTDIRVETDPTSPLVGYILGRNIHISDSEWEDGDDAFMEVYE
jgi:hypothetical protein